MYIERAVDWLIRRAVRLLPGSGRNLRQEERPWRNRLQQPDTDAPARQSSVRSRRVHLMRIDWGHPSFLSLAPDSMRTDRLRS